MSDRFELVEDAKTSFYYDYTLYDSISFDNGNWTTRYLPTFIIQLYYKYDSGEQLNCTHNIYFSGVSLWNEKKYNLHYSMLIKSQKMYKHFK